MLPHEFVWLIHFVFLCRRVVSLSMQALRTVGRPGTPLNSMIFQVQACRTSPSRLQGCLVMLKISGDVVDVVILKQGHASKRKHRNHDRDRNSKQDALSDM
jgi:hypothetical protein